MRLDDYEYWENRKNVIRVDPEVDACERRLMQINGLGTGTAGNVIGFVTPKEAPEG